MAGGKITRRALLVGSVAVAGGVAFGYYSITKPHPNPLEAQLAEGEAALTPWVKITREGVTLITPHTDLGQGAYSMQAALIAEELDIEFGQFDVSPGVPAPAYYNTAFAAEAPNAMMRTVMSVATKMMGLQGTGGSSSVPDSYEKLRKAGAVARETLKKAAARQAGVRVSELTTSNGAVHLPDGTSVPYTQLAEAASQISPVNSVELRDPSQWRMVGKTMERLDIVAKSTGTLTYGIDLQFENMLHAAVQLNPHQGGAMNSFDDTQARSMRGVIDIVPVTGGVAAIADNTWRAMKAAEAVDVDWGPASFPATMDEHWETLSNAFVEDNLLGPKREDGDVEQTIAASTHQLEAEYRAPYVAHAPLEPLSAVVLATDDRLDVWTCTQMPRFAEQIIERVSGYSMEQIHLHVQMVGGSFGHRLEHEQMILAIEVALSQRGTPVKLTYSREEDMTHDFPRQIAMSRLQGSYNETGVEAFDMAISAPSVMASQFGRLGSNLSIPDTQVIAGAADQPYGLADYRVRGYIAPPLAPISSWRSVGASSNSFFHEGFLDELIVEAGLDPLEERLRLINDPVARQVLEAVGEMSGWGSDLGPDRGRGVAFCRSFSTPVAEVVEVTRTPAGIKLDAVYVAADVGRVVDPVNFDNLVKGGVVWGLGHAMNCEITYEDGIAQQGNYHAHEGMRLYQCPSIEVRGLENGERVSGIGEPPVPPAAPALANAIFAATGQRLREMPFNKHIAFV